MNAANQTRVKHQARFNRARVKKVFDFMEAIIIVVFGYIVLNQKKTGMLCGFDGEDLDDYIFKLFDYYPIYGFIKEISDNIGSISIRPDVIQLRGYERHMAIAEKFLIELKPKYNNLELIMFGIFQSLKGIAHIYGNSAELEMEACSEKVANNIHMCIKCDSIPSKKCPRCLQIIYCENPRCLQTPHDCCNIRK